MKISIDGLHKFEKLNVATKLLNRFFSKASNIQDYFKPPFALDFYVFTYKLADFLNCFTVRKVVFYL